MLVIFNGAQARSIRKEKGFHLAALAESADATERYLSDLEHGKKWNPSAAYLYKISRALGVSMESLMQVIPDGDEQHR